MPCAGVSGAGPICCATSKRWRARGGNSKAIGEALRSHARQMLHWWHRVRDGTRKRSSFRSSMSPLRQEVERLLEAGSRCGVPKTAGVCRDLLKRREALWTCVHLAGVAPTNNAAERAMRPRCAVAQGEFRHAERAGFALCRSHDDRCGHR